ncbi:hypothetical protein SAMN05421856_103421 [Chryseobacterium taichungense]|uniref:Uncharacterized protein n=1 Tax=Chryseobacterium taichungense TaxID=295069 RepID=A0A1H7YML5_9FLAO|nr:hypothetical protein [Chryseobacterium taichungense]SEM47350.1 hypothetical protein SAMN05421856_103421 [Chryseobacterium taichungense]
MKVFYEFKEDIFWDKMRASEELPKDCRRNLIISSKISYIFLDKDLAKVV